MGGGEWEKYACIFPVPTTLSRVRKYTATVMPTCTSCVHVHSEYPVVNFEARKERSDSEMCKALRLFK